MGGDNTKRGRQGRTPREDAKRQCQETHPESTPKQLMWNSKLVVDSQKHLSIFTMQTLFPLYLLVLSVGCLPQKSGNHSDQDLSDRSQRQSGLELLTFGIPLVATLLREPDQINVKPIFDPSYPQSGSAHFQYELAKFRPNPVEMSGRTQCTSRRATKTATTSVMNTRGRLQFVSEATTSSIAGSSGDDPRRPPTPPPRPTPQPRLNLKRRKQDPKKNTQYFIQDPTQQQQQHDGEVEIVLIDDEDNEDIQVVEVFAPPGARAVLTNVVTCGAPLMSGHNRDPADWEELTVWSSESESTNGPDSQTFSSRLPPLRTNPGSDRKPTASNEPRLPHWDGLLWGRPESGVTNTCIMDPFFSHVIYISRRYPRYFRIHLNLDRSRPEEFVFFLSQTHHGWSKSQLSEGVHKAWAITVPSNTFQTTRGVIDMKLTQENAVFVHFRHSNRIWVIYQCQCDMTSREDIEKGRREWSPAQIRALNAVPSDPASSKVLRKVDKKCKTCKGPFQYVRALVSQATWFHSFPAPRSDARREDYPLSIETQEMGTNGIVHFDLGYFSYGMRRQTRLDHHVSVHHIEGQGFYFYDCMQGAQLQPIPSTLDQGYVLTAVTYFRRYDETRPR